MKCHSRDERDIIILAAAAYLEFTAEYCQMSLQAAGRMINNYATYLDDVGFTTRNDNRARSFLMLLLVESEESPHTPSGCDDWLVAAVRKLLESE